MEKYSNGGFYLLNLNKYNIVNGSTNEELLEELRNIEKANKPLLIKYDEWDCDNVYAVFKKSGSTANKIYYIAVYGGSIEGILQCSRGTFNIYTYYTSKPNMMSSVFQSIHSLDVNGVSTCKSSIMSLLRKVYYNNNITITIPLSLDGEEILTYTSLNNCAIINKHISSIEGISYADSFIIEYFNEDLSTKYITKMVFTSINTQDYYDTCTCTTKTITLA